MPRNGTKEEAKEVNDIISSNEKAKFLLDTNVIFAYLNKKSPFHLEAKSSIDALKIKKNTWFIISYIVMGEFIAHKEQIGIGQCSIKKALKSLELFIGSLKNSLHGGPALDTKIVMERYKKHSRRVRFIEAGFTDFMILTQAEEVNNIRILTCDKKMYKCGKSIFKDRIYYLPNVSNGIKSDYPRLMLEIQQKL